MSVPVGADGCPLDGLIFVLIESRPVLITSRTPTEAKSHSLMTALLYVPIIALLSGLAYGLFVKLLGARQDLATVLYGLAFGLLFGLIGGLNNGGWFVLLQKVVHRRLARAGNLPAPPYYFLEWGIEKQIFRRVGAEYAFATTSSSSTWRTLQRELRRVHAFLCQDHP